MLVTKKIQVKNLNLQREILKFEISEFLTTLKTSRIAALQQYLQGVVQLYNYQINT